MNKNFAYAPQFGSARPEQAAKAAAAMTPMTLTSLIASLFSVSLREKLDADTRGDRADAAYTWGM